MAAPLDPSSAALLLTDLGFLAHADLPDGPGDSYLLVALRTTPSTHHFDPERLTYWVTRTDRGAHAEITAGTKMPIVMPFSWGTIRVEDRFGIANEWVSSGGELEAAAVDGSVICVFRSEAPILRRGGHSQGWDHGAANLAAWFGRIKIAVDYVPGFEQHMAAASPRVRFAAFVADLAASYRAGPGLQHVHPDLWHLVRAEEFRLKSVDPIAWQAGLALAAETGRLAETPAPG